MIFEHTSREKGMWRGWIKNGQSLELHRSRSGWDFGAGILMHSNAADKGSRILCLKFWRWSAYIPLGVTSYDVDINSEPQWSVFASDEFGLWFRWGKRSILLDWPWAWHTLAYEMMLPDGSWGKIQYRDEGGAGPYTEKHPYTYTLRSGDVQSRTATVTKRRHVITWRAFKALGWPSWVKESINVEFDGEVGEEAGSWKGGCIGCGYDMRKGETMLCALRRMEKEMRF